MAAITIGLLLLAGITEAMFGFRQAREQANRAQAIQARAVATEVHQVLKSVRQGSDLVQALPWGAPGFGIAERRAELQRLMLLQPFISAIHDVDHLGLEWLAVSRSAPDAVRSLRPIPSSPPGFGPVWFDEEGVPRILLTLNSKGGLFARTHIQIDLRFLADLTSGLRPADGGDAYLVDDDGRLIAHSDPTQALRRLMVNQREVILQARAALRQRPAVPVAMDVVGLSGKPSVTTAVLLGTPNWLLMVEQPRTLVMQPAALTMQRTILLMGASALLAMVVSMAFARRMAAPIARLREATAAVASGNLTQRIELQTGDEIQGLAEDFNAMSARLQKSYGELEQKVEQRTAELALRRDEAERANAAKTRFLASASHDLRQPMHAIGLLVGVLRERLHDPGLQGLADKTHQAVQSMEGLFGSLLDVSKLDAGAVQPQSRPFALQDLLHRVANAYAPLAEAKSLRLRARPSSLVVHTDPALLERMVGNLVTNAIRYTTQGGVLVACRRRRSGWVLQVIDSGCGIAADHLDLIFEEFVRLDGAHARDQGLGLGLAIVKRTAGLLGLAISVRSRPGHGSVFELSLPVVDAVPTPVAGPGLPGELQRQVQGAFVLVVDDDARNLEATAGLFQQWGCLVATAANASAALDELGRHLRPPDVVVTDFRLGAGLHGLDLIRQVRAHAGQWVPALLVTAETQLPQTLDGDTQLLQKPVGPERLLQALAQSLAGTDRA